MQIARKARILTLLVVLLVTALPVAALKTPSKTAPEQDLAARQADLAKIQEVLNQEEISQALAAHGLSEKQIHQRLARFSPEELHALSSQIEQLQAAGAQVPTYIWILLGVLLGVLIITAIV